MAHITLSCEGLRLIFIIPRGPIAPCVALSPPSALRAGDMVEVVDGEPRRTTKAESLIWDSAFLTTTPPV